MKIKNKESAITLIALVVTVVVLLILAAISIGVLTGDNGIIKQAQNAKEDTEIADEKEKVELSAAQAAGNDTYGNITEENLAEELTKNIGERDVDYTLEKEGDIFIVTYIESNRSYIVDANGNIGEAVKREGLKVGDYVDYKPTPNTTGYTADKLTSDITGLSSNKSTITQDQQYAKDGTGMTWQILRIYADGSIDLIGSTTSQYVYFMGANGYNNGVTVVNDICETLYSNEKLNTKARSVRYEDLEYWLTEEGEAVRDAYTNSSSGVTYGQTKTYTSSSYGNYPNLYAQEIGAGIDTEIVNTTGLGISNKGTASGYTKASTSLTVTQTYWNCSMNSTNFGEGYKALQTTNSYWLASRCASCNSTNAYFGLRYVSRSGFYGGNVFGSNGNANSLFFRLRPVVSLSSSVQIESCTGENSVNNMHKIQY